MFYSLFCIFDFFLWVIDVQVILFFDEIIIIGDVDILFKVFVGGKNVSKFLMFLVCFLCSVGWIVLYNYVFFCICFLFLLGFYDVFDIIWYVFVFRWILLLSKLLLEWRVVFFLVWSGFFYIFFIQFLISIIWSMSCFDIFIGCR